MKKKTVRSTAELAQQLGVSRWTVSRVLNRQPGIGDQTRKRILQAASDANFTPNPFARGLRGGRTGLVGVCVQGLENLHLSGKLSAFEQGLAERGLRIMIAMHDGTPAKEEAAIRRFIDMRVEAVTLVASTLLPKSRGLLELKRSNIPYVLLDPIHPNLPHSVSVDRAKAMRLAVARLRGHSKKLIALGIDPEIAYGKIRWEGLGNQVEHLYEPGTQQFDFLYGHRLGLKLAGKKWKKVGVVALNDRIALGALRALLDSGRKVPEEVAMLGYDNMSESEFFRPSLTSLDPQPEILISAAITRLFEWIEVGEPKNEPILIEARLVERESA